jgi:hypothetical protein
MSKVKSNCPLRGFRPCKEHDCSWYIQIRGTNPNTGQEVDDWGCAMAWMPVLMIENSQQQRQTGAAVESFRNEVVKANKENQEFLLTEKLKKEPKIIGDQTKLTFEDE